MKTRRKVYKTVPFQNENICRHRRMKCAIKPNIEIKKRKRAHIAGPSRNGNVSKICRFGYVCGGGSLRRIGIEKKSEIEYCHWTHTFVIY